MISLTDTDYANIDCWRRHYGHEDGPEECAPVPEILKTWDAAKSQYLYKLLGNQVMLTEDYTFKANNNEIQLKLYDLVNFSDFKEKLIDYFYNIENGYGDTTRNISYLIEASNLYSNIYKYETFYINPPFISKKIKVERGCKVSRILGKIAKEINLEKEYEEFRLKHSQILNTKEVHGQLVLSIHPLDYLTMSDNDCGWDSCMSWRHHEGEYRQGTIEMMNSPYVLVAYLRNPSDISLPNGGSWSNKQWRELFIVDKDIICNIRAYPYESTPITDKILEKLRDLAAKNLGWTHLTTSIEDIPFGTFFLGTNYMYNDFDRDDENTYHCYYNPSIEEKVINYSGPDMCIYCGSLSSIDEEEKIACEDCINPIYCEHCGEKISHSDEYFTTADHQILCKNCENSTELIFCDVSGEFYYYPENVSTIKVIHDNEFITSFNLGSNCPWFLRDKWFNVIPSFFDEIIDYEDLTAHAKEKLLIL